jgi:flagellar FliL protein
MAEVAKNKGGVGSLLLSLLVLSLAGLGAGYGVASMSSAPPETAKPPSATAENQSAPEEGGRETSADGNGGAEDAGQAEAAEEEAVAPSELVIVPCPPVIANLREPAKVWIRLEANLVVRRDAEKAHEALAAEAAQHVLAYLRTLRIEDIQGATGLYDVSADLNEVVKGASQGAVREVLIAGLVVE